MPIFWLFSNNFLPEFTHFQFWSRFIYFREFLILKYICSVFPIKLEKNDSFQRPRKSHRFCGLLWLIFGLLHDLFQVKCSKERIEILTEYVQNDQFKSPSYESYNMTNMIWPTHKCMFKNRVQIIWLMLNGSHY